MNLRNVFAIVCSCLFAVSCWAQEANAPKFESHSRLVVVPVKVLDSKGMPVANLTQKDFSVVSDGKPQTILSFEAPAAPDAPPPNASDPDNPLEFNNIVDRSPRHVTVIAFDPQHTPPDERAQAVRSALKFLASQNAPNESIALVAFLGSGLQIIHDFTPDREALIKSLKATKFTTDSAFAMSLDTTANIASSSSPNETALRRGQQVTNDMERQMQNMSDDSTSDTQSDGLQSLANMLQNTPGQKAVIWITHGFRLKMELPTMGTVTTQANSGRGTRTDTWVTTFRQLGSQNISVYPIDARGLLTLNDMADKSDMDSIVTAHPADMAGGRNKAQNQSNEERLAAVGWIADETGGRAYFNTNNISAAIVGAITQASDSYVLSFAVPLGTKKGWHPIQVKSEVEGVKIQAKNGYVIEEVKKGKDDKTLANAMLSPFAVGSLPLMMRWTSATPAKDKNKRVVNFQIAVVPGALDFSGGGDPKLALEIRAIARDAADRAVAGAEKKVEMPLDADKAAKLVASGFSYTGAMELEPGDYGVTFGVQDLTTGRVGTVKAILRLQP